MTRLKPILPFIDDHQLHPLCSISAMLSLTASPAPPPSRPSSNEKDFFATMGLITLIANAYREILRQKSLSDLAWTSPVGGGHGRGEKLEDMGMK